MKTTNKLTAIVAAALLGVGCGSEKQTSQKKPRLQETTVPTHLQETTVLTVNSSASQRKS